MPSDPNPKQFPPRPTSLAWMILRDIIQPGDTAIDATAGNGHDTAFLAECVGPTGKILAFDVQDAAIRSANQRVEESGASGWVDFHACSHCRMSEFSEPESASVIMFNLGYLPGVDHSLTTLKEGTLTAVESAAITLKSGGILSIVCYPGHEGGADEATAVEEWLELKASVGWRVAKYAMCGTLRPSPFLLIAKKGKS